MIQEKVSVSEACGGCGAIGNAVHAQSSSAGVLRYSISFQCGHCDWAFEADGDEPPEPIRRGLLASSGTWQIASAGDPGEWLLVAKFLVDERGLARSAAVLLAKDCSAPLAIGTRPEIAGMKDRLAALGVSTVVRRV